MGGLAKARRGYALGALARGANSAAVTFDAAAVSLLGTMPLLAIFAVLARRSTASLAVAS